MGVGTAKGAKTRGVKAERLVKQWLIDRGYEALRVAGSHGRGDVVTCTARRILLLEVKYTRRKPSRDIIRGDSRNHIHLLPRVVWWWCPGEKIEMSRILEWDWLNRNSVERRVDIIWPCIIHQGEGGEVVYEPQ